MLLYLSALLLHVSFTVFFSMWKLMVGQVIFLKTSFIIMNGQKQWLSSLLNHLLPNHGLYEGSMYYISIYEYNEKNTLNKY